MRKNWLLALALLAPALAATDAQAIDTGRTYEVRFDGERVGTWQLRNRVAESRGGLACRYTIMWKDINRAPLKRTRLCKIDEFKASDDFDCEVSRRGFFDTVVYKADRPTCHGFDDFGQEVNITNLIAGESGAARRLNGIVETSSIGDVQSMVVL